jgi:flagella basal body P-ring formation protein FlgA
MESLGLLSIRRAMRALAQAARALTAAASCVRVAWLAALLCTAAAARAGDAPSSIDSGLEQQVRSLALAGTAHEMAGVTRVDIEVGQLDPRLRLAPCARVQPYLPPNARLWGKTRIGLRCTEGPSRWNVYLPITVKAYGQALVAATPLPVGTVLTAQDLAQAEVDLAEDASVAVHERALAVGRTLTRGLEAGQSLRQSHLKARQWFAAGDLVRVVALGAGFSVSGEGQALTPGLEGQPARVRTESGRVLTGMPTGEHRVELSL